MKLHLILASAVAIGLLSLPTNSIAHGGGGGGGGGGGHGGGNFHGGGFHGGFHGHGGRFFHGRFFGPGIGFYGYGYPWWGWDYGYNPYPYYGYNGYYGYYGDGAYGDNSNDNSHNGDQDPRWSSTRGVQAALAWRGYYNGRIDGVMGQETRTAIQAFQKNQGLPATGQIDSGLIKALRTNPR